MRRFICLAWLLFTLDATAAGDFDTLQQIRFQAFSVSSELLLYYNPNQDGGDPRHAAGYRQGLQRLQQLASDQPEVLQRDVSRLLQMVAALEAQPLAEIGLRPSWINPILEAQATLERNAAQLDGRQQGSAGQAIDVLQLDLARLLLLYETRTFGSLAVYVMDMDDDSFVRLDRQIMAGFEQLTIGSGEHREALDGLRRKYDFIRPRLLQHGQGWVPESAFYYLDGIGRRLESLQ